jgi:DNA-binding NarL/FixJ family response regulator
VEYHHVLACEAALRDGWGDPASWIRPAEAFFTNAGYEVVARACRSIITRAGGAAPRRGRGDSVVPAALRSLGITSRELDVLRLVADGLSNREIGERLFLSPRTVERHVASLFDRTSIRNRSELADFFRSQTG